MVVNMRHYFPGSDVSLRISKRRKRSSSSSRYEGAVQEEVRRILRDKEYRDAQREIAVLRKLLTECQQGSMPTAAVSPAGRVTPLLASPRSSRILYDNVSSLRSSLNSIGSSFGAPLRHDTALLRAERAALAETVRAAREARRISLQAPVWDLRARQTQARMRRLSQKEMVAVDAGEKAWLQDQIRRLRDEVAYFQRKAAAAQSATPSLATVFSAQKALQRLKSMGYGFPQRTSVVEDSGMYPGSSFSQRFGSLSGYQSPAFWSSPSSSRSKSRSRSRKRSRKRSRSRSRSRSRKRKSSRASRRRSGAKIVILPYQKQSVPKINPPRSSPPRQQSIERPSQKKTPRIVYYESPKSTRPQINPPRSSPIERPSSRKKTPRLVSSTLPKKIKLSRSPQKPRKTVRRKALPPPPPKVKTPRLSPPRRRSSGRQRKALPPPRRSV